MVPIKSLKGRLPMPGFCVDSQRHFPIREALFLGCLLLLLPLLPVSPV